MDALTLDQFCVFITVAEAGSFAAAARRLGRAQSAVTYAVQRLEASAGVPLFDRTAYRAQLTDAGQALLPRARRVVESVETFRSHADGFRQGVEAQVEFAVAGLVPLEAVAEAMRDFQTTFPNTTLRITTEWQDAVRDAVIAGRAELALLTSMLSLPPELEGDSCGRFALVAVASPDHPLAQVAGRAPAEVLEAHTQIVVTSARAENIGPLYGVLSPGRWYVTDLRTKHVLLLSCAGWGSMPLPSVQRDLDDGRLVQIHPERWEGADRMPVLEFGVIKARGRSLGPAAQWLVDRLRRDGPDGGTAQVSPGRLGAAREPRS